MEWITNWEGYIVKWPLSTFFSAILHILERWWTSKGGLLPTMIQTSSLESKPNMLLLLEQILLLFNHAKSFLYNKRKKQKCIKTIQIPTKIHKLFKLKNTSSGCNFKFSKFTETRSHVTTRGWCLPDHIECFFRKGGFIVFEHLVHVLIMSPWHHYILQATVRFVHTKFGTEMKTSI